MSLLRILYWGVSYSVGLICLTAVIFRYFQARDEYAFKIAAYLLPFGLSVVSLGLMEAFPQSSVSSAIFAQLALIGASLVVVAFPAYALCFDAIRTRRRLARILKFTGFVLAGANVLVLALPEFFLTALRFITLIVLGLTIFIGMTWIGRSDRHRPEKRPAAPMVSLFLLFLLVVVFDFFRAFIPPLRDADYRYVFFPAFYAYLNAFLLYSHVTVWARHIADGGNAGPDPAPAALKRFGVSVRETEVLTHLARGRTYGEIADSLCVSLATIKTHVSHLYEKTGTRNKVELINLLYDSAGTAPNQPNTR